MDNKAGYHGKIPTLVPLTVQVYSIIKRRILDLELRPGEVLVEADLARQLGTSKTPVREALRTLEKESLVVITPYKGAFVAKLSPDDMQEIYQVRGALEGMIARIAVRDFSDEQIREIEGLQSKSEAALAGGQIVEASHFGAQTHRYLLKNVYHRRILSAHNNLDEHLERFQRALEQIPGRVAKSVIEHRKIVDAIVARDADKACLAIISHAESFLAEYLSDFRSQATGGQAASAEGR